MKKISAVLAAILLVSLATPAIAADDANKVKVHKPATKKHVAKKPKKSDTKQGGTHKAGDFTPM